MKRQQNIPYGRIGANAMTYFQIERCAKVMFIALAFSILSIFSAIAQSATNYRIMFDKRTAGDGTIKIECAFTINFAEYDSITLDFGGPLQDETIQELHIMPDNIRYNIDYTSKQITFYRNRRNIQRIKMEYIYMNLTSALMYGDSGAEIWESIYSPSGEFYYPTQRGMEYSARIKFSSPDSLLVVSHSGIDATKWHRENRCVPINFAFLSRDKYEKQLMTGGYRCGIYQVIGKQADSARCELLCQLTEQSIRWFEEKYGDKYLCNRYGISAYPAFIFHNGNGSFNRYNMGFISASQEKFATYPDIYPLIHEVGHRWMGEYTMFIDSGVRGYAFIIETLNEFMTLMCIRDIVGIEEYETLLDSCRASWNKIKDTEQDIHPVDVTDNNNISVTYRKGIVMLDNIAQEIGYDTVVFSIARFYNECNGKPDLQYADFERLCSPIHDKLYDMQD